MARFRYAALDASGRTVNGELSVEERNEVPRRLREMGLFATDVSEVAEQAGATYAAKGRRRGVSSTDVAILTRQLADMIGAGLPSFRSLGVLVEQSENPAMKEMLNGLRQDVQEGAPLSSALANHPRLFNSLYVNMVRAGETSGHLDEVLTRLADFLEKAARRRSQIVSALTYPVVLVVVAFGAVGFLVSYVLPKLGTVFADFQASLPPLTIALLAVSGFLSKTWWLVLVFLFLAHLGFRRYARTKSGGRALDRLVLRLPILGGTIRKMVISRFARTLGTMLAGGVNILEALNITADAVGNQIYGESVGRVKEQVREGIPLAESLGGSGVFLPVVVHMAAVGEETGNLSEMMLKVADSLDFEVDSALVRFTSLLEPIMILVMGVVVGAIVASILLPIFQLSSAVSQ